MPSDSKELLRRHGLQVTTQRVAILESVEADPHCTADAVETSATERLGSISHQAVYDGLAALVDGGLLRRIQPSGSRWASDEVRQILLSTQNCTL